MSETQKSIADWAHDTFGPAHSIPRVLGRAAEEAAELVRKVTIGTFTPEEIAEEAADTAIVLARAAELLHIEEKRIQREVRRGLADMPKATTAAEYAFAAMSQVAEAGAAVSQNLPNPMSAAAAVFGARLGLECCCRLIGQDLSIAIELKMQVNRNRRWKLDGSGHGYHERPKGATL
jgi:NTP pyrophosphatase (non-canonical NTP hydrolase)